MEHPEHDPVVRKLAAARTRLILDKPFLGALTLRLPLTGADPSWCPTTGTDARKLYYNPQYIEALDPDQVQFVLAHEALHCALSHFARRGHRNRRRWDLACDLAINPLLLRDGLRPPPGVWIDASFEGMTAEEIYPSIDENDENDPMDQHLYDGASHDPPPRGQPPPLGADQRETLAIQWQQRLAGAAQMAMQAGKLSASMARLIDHLLQPRLPWRALLAHHMSTIARDDYSFMRPSRREGAAILPSLRSHQIDIVTAIDTSGSISRAELAEFADEINALKGQIKARVTVLCCDAALAPDAPWICEPWETLELPETVAGGGGTAFAPVFDWIARQDRAPDLLVYFTDGKAPFPNHAPHYPVIWLVKGRATVPWGQRIQLN